MLLLAAETHLLGTKAAPSNLLAALFLRLKEYGEALRAFVGAKGPVFSGSQDTAHRRGGGGGVEERSRAGFWISGSAISLSLSRFGENSASIPLFAAPNE